MQEQQETDTILSEQDNRKQTIGIIANIIFLIFLLFPFVILNGVTMHSNKRFIIWIAGIAALILRIRKNERGTVIASIVSLVAFVILYTMLAIGAKGMLIMFTPDASLKIHFLTFFVLLISSITMIHPALLIKKAEKQD